MLLFHVTGFPQASGVSWLLSHIYYGAIKMCSIYKWNRFPWQPHRLASAQDFPWMRALAAAVWMSVGDLGVLAARCLGKEQAARVLGVRVVSSLRRTFSEGKGSSIFHLWRSCPSRFPSCLPCCLLRRPSTPRSSALTSSHSPIRTLGTSLVT